MSFYTNFNIDHKKIRKNTKITYYKSICYIKKIKKNLANLKLHFQFARFL
jgi:hypothetical protein